MKGFEHNFDYFDKVLSDAPFYKGFSIVSYLKSTSINLPVHMESHGRDSKEFLYKVTKVWNWKTQRLSEKSIYETSKGREYIKDGSTKLYLDEFKKYEKLELDDIEVDGKNWYFDMIYKVSDGVLYEKYIGTRNENYDFKSYSGGISGTYSTKEIGDYIFLTVVRDEEPKEGEFCKMRFARAWKK